MASLSKDKNGNRTIQFVGGDRKRRSIRLGKMPAKDALNIKVKVEALNAATIAQMSWDSETAAWVGRLAIKSPTLHDRLAAVGLVPRRAASVQATLGAFLASYIAGRSDVKRGTKNVYKHTQDGLLEKFGAVMSLQDITPGDADEFRRWLATDKGLGENTIRRRCGVCRQFFRAAVRKRLIAENPFGEMKSISVRSNKARDYFLTRQDAARVLDACPDAEWRLIFALSRYGGLRCPSETLALRWSDIDWANNRFTVTSPKTEHHEGGEFRVVPIFTELRPYLDDAYTLAEPGSTYVIRRYRDCNANLRTQLHRIIKRAGLTPWEKLFQNLRATRATELAAEFPAHVAADWLGHSTMVAQKHYWRTTEDDFARAAAAAGSDDALHNAVQSPADPTGPDESAELAFAGTCENAEDFAPRGYARQDSNLRPTD